MKKAQFPAEGIQHATINGHRFHLRTGDPIKDNFLWINGQNPPIILDKTAAEFVSLLVKAMWKFQSGEGDESPSVIQYVIDEMYKIHGNRKVTRERIKSDLDRIFGTLMAVAAGECPAKITMGSKKINYGDWIAPARMDLAVTYRCNLKCDKCYAGDKQNFKELTTEEWTKIYKILWQIGIPQVVFTGGEPTLRPDIVELVSEAEEFVTGLITNGTNLVALAKPLKNASLDYVQITIESHLKDIHENMTCTPGSFDLTIKGIKAALDAGIQVVTNTTLTEANASSFTDTMIFLSDLGVKNIACNTLICSGKGTACREKNGINDERLAEILDQAQITANTLGINLQWYSPTCYNLGVNPINLGFGIKACSAAAHNMTIQSDGTVLPCQSWPESVGNILEDDWQSIWENDICLNLRDNEMKPEECLGCKFENTCSGGCPLDQSPRKNVCQKGGQNA